MIHQVIDKKCLHTGLCKSVYTVSISELQYLVNILGGALPQVA
jgi:hypothetical protein